MKFPIFKPPASLDNTLRSLKTADPEIFERDGWRRLRQLYAFARTAVPAYITYCKNSGVRMTSLRTREDLKKLPVLSKQSYCKTVSHYADLFPYRDIGSATTISATSGSTGEPFYFPRRGDHDAYYAFTAELFLRNSFGVDKKKKTLGLIGFGMGIWIGGIFTYASFNSIAQKGYKLSLVPVGPNVDLFLRSIKMFASYYDQIILMGYAPFIKDVVDRAPEYDVDLKKYSIKILTAAEGYSEGWKEYVMQRVGMQNRYTDFVNIYGTVELGTMAHETPTSNFIRHLASLRPEVRDILFGNTAFHIPTFCQYYPAMHYFEEHEGHVYGYGYATAMPLLRYSFPDKGGVLPYRVMVQRLARVGVDLEQEMKRAGLAQHLWRLPFVYVFERADSTTVFRGANIYAQEIRDALLHPDISRYATGKFSLLRSETDSFDPVLELHLELHHDANPPDAFTDLVCTIVTDYLRDNNSEFAVLHQMEGPGRLAPQIFLWPYQHPTHFSAGGKQRWRK
jgi:phenylacetate-CoA ligase